MIERQKKIYLCRPNGKILTQLNGIQTSSVQYSVHAKDYNDITFNVDRFIIVDGEPVESNGYEDLHVGMNILLEGCDMFQMQEPTVVNDGVKEYKVIRANSIEYEFQEKNWIGLKVNTGKDDSLEYLIPNNTNSFGIVERDNYIKIYQGNNSGRTDHSLLHYIIEKVPGWSIDDADIDQALYTREISIEEDNINLYALLTSVIGPKAECIFLFDTINKKIKAIAKESLNENYFDTNIFISMRNLASNIEVQTNEDSVFTVFNAVGEDNLDVGSVNYNDIYVYDLSYFMSEPWMSTETATKIQAWMDWRDDHRDEFILLSKQLEEKRMKIKEIIYRCPNDGDDWQQWDQMDRDNLTRAKEMYVSYLNAIREDADPDPSYDSNGTYIPRTNQEEDYEAWLLDSNKGYYTYIEIRDIIIPNIDIAYTNKGKLDDEKIDYVKTYETNYELFGISLLEGKETSYNQQLEQLDKYKKPWNQLTDEEKTKHSNEGQYNIKHDEYVDINEVQIPAIEAKLEELRAEVSTIESEVEDIEEDIITLVEKAKISDSSWNMTQDELDLFNQLCKYTDYTNKNILRTSSDDTIMMVDIQKTLYDDAVSKLSEVSQPQYTFSVSADNFFDIKEFASWKEKFELLRFMRVGIRDDYSVKLRLIGYTTNPCEIDSLLNVDFSNFVTSRSGRSDLTELLDMENNSPSKNSISIGNADAKNAEEYATKLFYMMSRSGLLSGSYGNTATTTSTNSSFTGVSTANVIQMYATSGYITDAVMSEAKITDYLDAVKVNAATVEAGTLIADRILLKNDASAILYQLNNLGSLVSEENKTLDGYVLTDRTILADKIVADTITAREITTDKLRGTGGWINLRNGSFWYGHGAYTNNDNFVSYKEDPVEKAAEEALAAQINNSNNSISWINGVLNIDGTITAREGSIGGFSVTTSYDSSGVGETTANNGHMFENSLYAQSANQTYEFEVGITSGAYAAGAGHALPTTKAFYIGQINKDAAWSTATDVFYVLHDGSMYATKGEIAGWTIDNAWLKKPVTTSGITYQPYLYAPASISPTSNSFIGVMKTENNTTTYPFYVRYDGYLYAQNANITGTIYATSGEFTGKITADSGYIGYKSSSEPGWVIKSGAIYSGTSAMSGTGSTTAGVFIGTAGIRIYKDSTHYVSIASSDGIINAVGANITGAITATSGTIGGCSIVNETLQIANANIISVDASKMTTGYIRSQNYNGSNGSITNTQGSVLNLANGQFNFGGGKLTFNGTSLSVNGDITATSGTIGGITANSSYGLYTNSKTSSTSTKTGFLISKDGGIYLGAYSNGSCPFQVASDGTLTATSATIKGSITADDGKIGDFYISDKGLVTSTGSYTTDRIVSGIYNNGDAYFGKLGSATVIYQGSVKVLSQTRYYNSVWNTDDTLGVGVNILKDGIHFTVSNVADNLGDEVASFMANGSITTEKNNVSIRAGNSSYNDLYCITTINNYNNVDIRAEEYNTSKNSGGNAGLYHRSTTGAGAKWLIQIDRAGTVTSNVTSDARYKKILGNIPEKETLALLRNIIPCNFIYKSDDNGIVQNGMIAQRIRDVLISNNIGYRSYLVIEDAETPETYHDLDISEDKVTYGLDYSKFTPVLWSGWQYHDKQIQELSAQISELKSDIKQLKKQLQER